MNKIVKTMMVMIQNLKKNFSDYCLAVGIIFILYYIKITYGTPTLILSVGIIFSLTSLVIELNKKNNKK